MCSLKQRNYPVDTLRTLACLAVILFHLGGNTYILPANGYLWTEFFFMVSGLFLFQNMEKIANVSDLLLKYVKKIYGCLVLSIIVGMIVYYKLNIKIDIWQEVANLTFFSASGFIQQRGSVGPAWFIAPLLIAIAFFAMLIKLCRKEVVVFTASLVSFFSYIILINNGPVLQWRPMWHGLLSFGVLRALGGVGLGIVVSNFVSRVKISRYFSLFGVALLCFLVYQTIFTNMLVTKPYFILLSQALILLFAAKKSEDNYLYKLLDIKSIKYVSSLSLPLFLLHWPLFFWCVTQKAYQFNYTEKFSFVFFGSLFIWFLWLLFIKFLRNMKERFFHA